MCFFLEGLFTIATDECDGYLLVTHGFKVNGDFVVEYGWINRVDCDGSSYGSLVDGYFPGEFGYAVFTNFPYTIEGGASQGMGIHALVGCNSVTVCCSSTIKDGFKADTIRRSFHHKLLNKSRRSTGPLQLHLVVIQNTFKIQYACQIFRGIDTSHEITKVAHLVGCSNRSLMLFYHTCALPGSAIPSQYFVISHGEEFSTS